MSASGVSVFGRPVCKDARVPAPARAVVNIRHLKEFAASSLPQGSALRDIILADRDELGAEEFLAKVEVWARLLRREGARPPRRA